LLAIVPTDHSTRVMLYPSFMS